MDPMGNVLVHVISDQYPTSSISPYWLVTGDPYNEISKSPYIPA